MRVVLDVTAVCTVSDPFRLLEAARAEVEAHKLPEDRERYYPQGVSEALQILVREAIATRLQESGAVILHEIGQEVRELDFPGF